MKLNLDTTSCTDWRMFLEKSLFPCSHGNTPSYHYRRPDVGMRSGKRVRTLMPTDNVSLITTFLLRYSRKAPFLCKIHTGEPKKAAEFSIGGFTTPKIIYPIPLLERRHGNRKPVRGTDTLLFQVLCRQTQELRSIWFRISLALRQRGRERGLFMLFGQV